MIYVPPAIHAPAPARPVDIDRVLRCVLELEQHRWAWPGGALAFQFASWAEDSDLPYSDACNPVKAAAVAHRRLMRFRLRAEAAGVLWTPTVALDSWRRGIDRAIRNAKAGTPSDYAVRGTNLYRDESFR